MVRFLFGLTDVGVDMPVLSVGDFQIAVDTVQKTEHALKFKDVSGAVYYAPASVGNCPSSLKIKSGDTVYTVGESKLYQEVTSFNSCEKISLIPGCYTVVIMGGRGGDGGHKSGNGGLAVEQVYSFNLTENTDVYALRGGDGNNGGVNSSSDIYSGGGGGASGVPSMFAVGTEYIISQGGAGGNGAGGYDNDGAEQNCGAGGGGFIDGGGNGLEATGTDSWLSDGFVCGAGGGGAVGGTAGAASSGFLYNGSAGSGATDSAGGNGGDSSMSGLLGSSGSTGGTGGANVSYSCGGVMVWSYGGGGGGAVSTGGLFGSGVGVNGGNGGSGGRNTSSSSYVRIYRFG